MPAARASGQFPAGTRILEGPAGLSEAACLPEVGTVVSAIVGTAGLRPTLDAIEAAGPAKVRQQLADLCQAEIRELHNGSPTVIAEVQIDGAWVGYPDPEDAPPADQT